MPRRNYSSTAVDTTLSAGIAAGDVLLTVVSASGYPAVPFVIAVDPGLASEELILVGAKAGTTFSSLTRALDGSLAAAHGFGATVKHVAVGLDYDDFAKHVYDEALGHAGVMSVVNVKDYGAVGDDATDDTAALVAAIAAASAGDVVSVPPGTYRHTGFTHKAGVTLAGTNQAGCILKYTPTTGDMITLPADPDYAAISNLQLRCLTTTTGWAIKSAVTGTAHNVRIERVEVVGALKGIHIKNGLNCHLEELRLNGQGSGVAGGIGLQIGESGAGGNGMVWSNVYTTGYETGQINYGKASVAISPKLEGAVTGFVNYGNGVVLNPWTTQSAGANTTDFDMQTAGLAVLGYGSASWKISYASTTVQQRTVVIPESHDRAYNDANNVGGPAGIKLGGVLIRADGKVEQRAGTADAGYGALLDSALLTGERAISWPDAAGQVAVMGGLAPAQITANQNNYNPTGFSAGISYLRITSDAARTITGIAAGTSVEGRQLVLHNAGGYTITLSHSDGLSDAANRIILQDGGAAGGVYALRNDGCVVLVYGNGKWRVLSNNVLPVVATASLLAASAVQDGLVCIEDGGAGDRNFVGYAGGEMFRAIRKTLGPWTQDNVAASQTAVALALYGDTTRSTRLAVRAGSVTGIVVRSNEARTAGTLTVEVTIDGVSTGLTAVLDGTNTTVKATTQAEGLDTFAAGAEIGVKITTDGTWAPTTADVTVEVEVVE